MKIITNEILSQNNYTDEEIFMLRRFSPDHPIYETKSGVYRFLFDLEFVQKYFPQIKSEGDYYKKLENGALPKFSSFWTTLLSKHNYRLYVNLTKAFGHSLSHFFETIDHFYEIMVKPFKKGWVNREGVYQINYPENKETKRCIVCNFENPSIVVVRGKLKGICLQCSYQL